MIRLLQAKYRRKFRQVDMNPGDERNGSLQFGTLTLFPDLVLWEDSPKKPYAVVEVETGESVNHLEAMSQWANFAKSKSYLYLYVPASSVDSVKRLCTDHDIALTELTSYVVVADQVRFNVVTKVETPEPVVTVRPAPEKPAKAEKPVEPPETVPVAVVPAKAAEPAPAAPAPKIAAKAALKVVEKPAPVKVEKKPVRPEPKAEPKAAVKAAPKPAPKPVKVEKAPVRVEKRVAAPVKPAAKAKPAVRAASKPAARPARPAPAVKPRAAASRVAVRPAAKRAPAVAKARPKAVAARTSSKAAQKRK